MPTERLSNYVAYVKSDSWTLRKDRAFKKQRRTHGRNFCEGSDCGIGSCLEVHHRSYENFGNEKDEDLRIVCRACHRKIHELENGVE